MTAIHCGVASLSLFRPLEKLDFALDWQIKTEKLLIFTAAPGYRTIGRV